MPRKTEVPMIEIRTYHMAPPFTVTADKPTLDFWNRRNELRKAGIAHQADILTGTIVEGV